jgi:hypothetical protein
MSHPNPHQLRKSAMRTPEQIGHFLEQTGFVFEMRMNELFFKAGYQTQINEEFLDLEGNTEREIDIIASKVLNDINIHFVVECKQSATDKWIFICHKYMPRFYRAVKHLPNVDVEAFQEKKLFSGFHTFDSRLMPLAHNCLCYTIEGDKKGNHLPIDECVHKLPKALVALASGSEGGRHLFFPLALFTGQIFAVFYKGKLVVEERPFLQYFVSFESEHYRHQPDQPKMRTLTVSGLLMPALEQLESLYNSNREKKIRQAKLELSPSYQIDFVTESSLPEYLGLIEKQVAAVQTKDWPVPETVKTDAG